MRRSRRWRRTSRPFVGLGPIWGGAWGTRRASGRYLRDTGTRYDLYPQIGNYDLGLIQDDSAAQGRTVPTTYRSREEISYNGEAADANERVETDVAFLRAGPAGL